MKRFYCLILAMAVQAAQADNSALGKIVKFSSNKGHYTFQFAQSGGEDIVPGCRQLEVEVRYALAPQAWLPLARSDYPTKKQTNAAINFLKRALREGREIYFSSATHGLAPTSTRCTFASRALALEYRGEKELIVSYYGSE